MVKKLRVGIIDDENAKATDISTKLALSGEFKIEDKSYEFDPVVIPVKEEIDNMVNIFREEKIDALIIDYVLTRVPVGYKGVELAKEVIRNFGNFPIFILTSFSDDLFDKEDISVYNVFNYNYFNNPNISNYRDDFFMKLAKESINYKKQFTIMETTLKKLLNKKDKTIGDIDNINSISMELEKHLTKTNFSLSTQMQKDFTSNKLIEIMEKIEEKLGRINENKN